MLKSDKLRWGSLAQFFHWTIVALIIVQGAVGLIMVELPRKPNIIPIYSLHKSIGMTVLLLAVLRLAWRALDAHPADPDGMPRAQVIAARAGHALLYILLFLVPLSGWWYDSVSGLRPLYWFNLFEIPRMVAPDPALKELARGRHELLFWALVVVAVGHAAMALIHHFVKRDGTLARMLPARHALASAPAAAISPAPPVEENADVETNSAAVRPADPASRGRGA
jgi:cytochrome b561